MQTEFYNFNENEKTICNIEWFNSKIFCLFFMKKLKIYFIEPKDKQNFKINHKFSMKFKHKITCHYFYSEEKFLILALSNYIFFCSCCWFFEKKIFFFSKIKIKEIIPIKIESKIFYVIGENFSNLKSKTKNTVNTQLYILNLNELRFLKIFNLNEKIFFLNLKTQITNETILVISKKKFLNFFLYSLASKKILKCNYFNESEILSLTCFNNIILLSDKAGYISILNISTTKKSNFNLKGLKKIKLNNGFIILKTVLDTFSILIDLDGLDFILNLYDFKPTPVKSSFLYPFGKIFLMKFCPQKTKLIILNENFQLFICKTSVMEKKIEMISANFAFDIKKVNPIKFFVKKIKIQQCVDRPGKSFLLLGFDKYFQMIEIKKGFGRKIESNRSILNPTPLFFYDHMGRQLMVFKENFLIKLLTSNLSTKNSFGIKKSLETIDKPDNFNEKKNQFEIKFDLSGKTFAVYKKNFEIEIFYQSWSSPIFSLKNKIKMGFRRKCNCFEFSSDGNYLALAIFNLVQIWKLYPLKKVFIKKFSFNDKINHLNFLYTENKLQIIIVTLTDLLIFDCIKNKLISTVKLKIWDFKFNHLEKKFIIMTDSFFSEKLKITKSYFIFTKKNPIPCLILTETSFNENLISSPSLFWRNNSQYGNNIVFLNSLLNLIFIKY